MKPALSMMSLVSLLALATTCAGQPKLKETQVLEMAKIIAKKSKNDQDFVFEQSKYDENTGVWSLTPRMATSAGTYFLEIRDKDYYFRVGFTGNTGYTPKGSDKFRLPPDLKNIFKKIAGDPPK
jgi:hypothetical protein